MITRRFMNNCLLFKQSTKFFVDRISLKPLQNVLEMFISCNLICPNNTHDPIPLPDGEPVVIGRSKDTRIIDLSCSRHQVEITANWKTEDITVKQLGSNSSSIDGIELEKDREVRLQLTSTLYVLTGLYPQKVDIKKKAPLKNNPNVEISSSKTDKKRPADQEEKLISPPSKRQKVEMKESISEEEHIKDVEKKLNLLKKMKNDKMKDGAKEVNTEKVQKEKTKENTTDFKFSDKKEGEPASESKWDQYDKLVIHTRKGLCSRSKIAGFDIDGTIIGTQSGNVFPKHPGDWRILFAEIPKKLKELHSDGYKIVFFTNQLGVARGKVKLEDLKTKFTRLVDKLGVPVQILIATDGGMYRKPAQGMFYYLQEKGNDKILVDKESSFYVGDGAGRPEKWQPKRKKDFSCSDRLFALNLGIKFYTPEEFFLNQKPAPYNLPEYDPRKLKSTDPLCDPPGAKIVSDQPEVVIFAGYPGSGKSFFGKKYLEPKGYVHVNRDTLGTWQKCVSLTAKSLKEGKSVMVDNTNPDPESRARYIDVAKKAGVPCRCFVFKATQQQAMHNERFRELTDKTHKPINVMIMNAFKSKFKEPNMKEGYTEILKINFVPKFDNKKHELLYKQFLLEK
ncbi:bifunctional polynucleotide phosphatase/kinase-like [Mytilus galloprovincialis]|uniref:bifunctional polynucleotide phosphatase/kinase-like n=1 Tax=Mytilus galloprovincialis TaxID=29158 RepID=UPI003F7B8144